ncbi:hypothetical protein IFR05_014303 [Cadophora sp. M221]|nr:hypothetical protein IFR05_014303 [Cadophora sp. M221]
MGLTVLASTQGGMNSSTIALPAFKPKAPGVPWQTIFWTLVPLAISSMSQPGGRICGLPSRYRTYLRCSPILCAADTLSIVTNLAVICAYQKRSFIEAVAITLQSRFNDDARDVPEEVLEEFHDIEGVQSLEKMTWLRWLWFILGALPPAIKLMGMGGIPWEQAWGLMFLTSWTINEGLTVFASMNQSYFTVSNTGRISWPGDEQAKLSPGYPLVRNMLAKVNMGLATIALTVHTVILNGALRVVYRTWRLSLTPQAKIRSLPGWQYSTTISPGYVSVISIAMVAYVILSVFIFRRLRVRTASIFILPLFTTYLMLASASLNAITYGNYFTSSKSAEYVYIWSTVSMLAFLLVIQYFGRRFNSLGHNLLITYSDGADGVRKDFTKILMEFNPEGVELSETLQLTGSDRPSEASISGESSESEDSSEHSKEPSESDDEFGCRDTIEGKLGGWNERCFAPAMMMHLGDPDRFQNKREHVLRHNSSCLAKRATLDNPL